MNPDAAKLAALIAQLEQEERDLLEWLAVPTRRMSNPVGWTDRERELAHCRKALTHRRKLMAAA